MLSRNTCGEWTPSRNTCGEWTLPLAPSLKSTKMEENIKNSGLIVLSVFSFFFLLLLLNTLLPIVPHLAIEDLLHVIKLLFGRAWDNVIRTVAYRFLWCSKRERRGFCI